MRKNRLLSLFASFAAASLGNRFGSSDDSAGSDYLKGQIEQVLSTQSYHIHYKVHHKPHNKNRHKMAKESRRNNRKKKR
jgi:hypothetical protein